MFSQKLAWEGTPICVWETAYRRWISVKVSCAAFLVCPCTLHASHCAYSFSQVLGYRSSSKADLGEVAIEQQIEYSMHTDVSWCTRTKFVHVPLNISRPQEYSEFIRYALVGARARCCPSGAGICLGGIRSAAALQWGLARVVGRFGRYQQCG